MELFGIGWTEMLVIGIVALIVVGPQRLPEVARTIGRAIGYFSQQWRNIQQQIRDPIESETQNFRKQVREPIEGEVRNIQGDIQDFKDEISGVKKPRAPKAKSKASGTADSSSNEGSEPH